MPRSKFTLVPIPVDEHGEPVPSMPACENCGASAEMVIVHLRDGNSEWCCYTCHTLQMASILTDMAVAEAAEPVTVDAVSAYPDKLALNQQYGTVTP